MLIQAKPGRMTAEARCDGTHDAVVVGAGPAGAAGRQSALCEAGRRVLLVERFRLPRYKSCSGILIKKSLGLVKQYFGEEVPSAVCGAPVENRGIDLYR